LGFDTRNHNLNNIQLAKLQIYYYSNLFFFFNIFLFDEPQTSQLISLYLNFLFIFKYARYFETSFLFIEKHYLLNGIISKFYIFDYIINLIYQE